MRARRKRRARLLWVIGLRELHCGTYRLALDRPRIMGILNVTPDSFSDGGRYLGVDEAIRHALEMMEAGADIVDIGGESTRPGASPVSAAEERRRVLPVVRALAGRGVPLSIDTRRPSVMRAAIAEGVSMVNDVEALRVPGAVAAVAASDVAVCLVHMQGEPASMQRAPRYDDVVAEVAEFLLSRAQACIAAGIDACRIVLDPGIGFGKTLAHNVALLRELGDLCGRGFPVLVGLSRKSLVAALSGRPASDRVAGSIAGALAAVARGAAIVRVHDVAATAEALAVWRGLNA